MAVMSAPEDQSPPHTRKRIALGVGVSVIGLVFDMVILTVAAVAVAAALHVLIASLAARGTQAPLTGLPAVVDILAALAVALVYAVAMVIVIIRSARNEWDWLKQEARRRDTALFERLESDVDDLLKGRGALDAV